MFQTAPLAAPLAIAGPIEAELFVATDAPDTDFTAKLIDVYPPNPDYPGGYAMLLTDSIIRLRYAEDPAQTRLRTPAKWSASASGCPRWQTCSSRVTASASTSPPRTSRNST